MATRKPLEATKDDYYRELGKFVETYTNVEVALHLTFHNYAKVSIPVAAAIKRNSNAATLVLMIRGLLKVHKFDRVMVEDVTACLDQFDAISDFRNGTIHRIAKPLKSGERETTNITTLRSWDALEVSTHAVQDLRSATFDLARMSIRLFWHFSRSKADRAPEFRSAMLAPWLYIRVQPSKPNLQRRSAHPKPKRPPHASPQ